MRIAVGVLGLVGLGVTFAAAQTPGVQRGATLLPAVEPGPDDRPPVARAAADDPPPAALPTRPAAGWGTITDPNVMPASGILTPAAASPVQVPSVPTGDDGLPLTRRIRGAFATPPTADGPNANSPYRGTTSNGGTVYAGPPAYRWYGWGSVTPGANPNAPSGQYPKASANWYSITGATPGAFPTAVTNSAPAPGIEPPSYAGPAGTAPVRTPAAPYTPALSGTSLGASSLPPPDLYRPTNPDVRVFQTPPAATPPSPTATAAATPSPTATPALTPTATLPPPASLIPPPSSLTTTHALPAVPAAPSAPAAPYAPAVPFAPVMPAMLPAPVVPEAGAHNLGTPAAPGPLAPLPPPSGLAPAIATPQTSRGPTTAPPSLPATYVKPPSAGVAEPPTLGVAPTVPLPPLGAMTEPKPLALTPLPTSAPLPAASPATAGPGPAALPVSVTDYQLNWQKTTDTHGQWNSPNSPVKSVPASPVSPATLPANQPLPTTPAPAVLPVPTMPAPTVPVPVLPAPVLPAPNWQPPAASESAAPKPVARGQMGEPGPDPMIALVQKLCEGRAVGIDIRYTGSKRLSVCFECRSSGDGKSLVQDISVRPELKPYRIDFCVLVK